MRRIWPVLALALAVLPSANAQVATVEENGYLAARDGTRLRYNVVRPADGGPFPALINYEGYAAGTDAADNGVATYIDRLLERGYAVIGVSVRGTGCSEGAFDPFAKTMGQDGYDAVEWAAGQPWSDGRVGMIGVSFGGITQLLTAATRPPHLRAIAPSSALGDLYRDVAWPGGALEYDFPFAWTAIQKEGGTVAAPQAALAGDTECLGNYVAHESVNIPDYLIPRIILEHPYDDDTFGDETWNDRAPENGFPLIEVPAFLLNAWQDEQLPARIWGAYERFAHPELLWVNVSNGNHGRDYASALAQDLTLDFVDRFVRDVPNGFEASQPHVQIWMESAIQRDGDVNVPSWSIDLPGLPAPTPLSFYLRAGGMLSGSAPAGPEEGDSYLYPLPSPDVLEPGLVLGGRTSGQLTWKVPVPPGGAVAYTTDALASDLVLAGPASLDLWMTTTGADTDLQVTVTEVRPDGQETYVQRGWLRASHRTLDAGRSTALRPYHTHARSDAAELTPGEPTFMRLEVFPFAHAFRAGSKLRLWLEAPTGHTGFWAFALVFPPGVNTVLHDAEHPSRLVVGVLEGEVAEAPMPPCDSLRNQPCRTDPLG
ncbi:MAG: CocE/NonD family hydrolase [Actinomycetota bacterium]